MKLRKSFGKFWREEVLDPSGIFWLEKGPKVMVQFLEKEDSGKLPRQNILGLHLESVVAFYLEERP